MPPSQLLAAERTRRCSRCASLFVPIHGRALAALRLVCFTMIRRCRYAAHRVVRFLPCTAGSIVIMLRAPVRQEAARPRAVSSGVSSATVPTSAAHWESAVRLVCSCGHCRDSGSQRPTPGHECMASSRSLAAAGNAYPHSWVAWTRLCGCAVSHNVRSCGAPVRCSCHDPFRPYSRTALPSDVEI